MALADGLGTGKVRIAGKLSDAQVAMDDTALEANLDSVFNAMLTEKSLQIKTSTVLSKIYNRTLRKYILSAETQAA